MVGAPTPQQPLGSRASGHHHPATTSASLAQQGSKEPENHSPPPPPSSSSSSPSALWTEDWESDRAKDATTGRFLSKKARTCLRCLAHGLRCTLEFSGTETEPRCSACRRAGAGAGRCVRPALEDIGPEKTVREQRRLFKAGSGPTYRFQAEHATASWPAVVDEHYAGRLVYVNGMPLDPRDVNAMALPAFRDAADADVDAGAGAGADEENALADSQLMPMPAHIRTTPWRTVTWSDYLPVRENRSMVGEAGEDEGVVFQEVRFQPGDDTGEDGEEGLDVAGENGGEDGGEDEIMCKDDRIKFLQRIRRYPPRAMHLNEMLGETY
ncbi:hypothetical protein SLS62_010445 [Diatrype stigma]|uniref:Uncharacterized protein n=1 Tax=Diatrype stigma TaxID=117547 RepID=A0AAN9UHW5_9PEZI